MIGCFFDCRSFAKRFLCFWQRSAGRRPAEKIRFDFIADEEGLLVEVQDRSETEDLDAVDFPENLTAASESELAKLGLALLGKMAQEVAHIRISG